MICKKEIEKATDGEYTFKLIGDDITVGIDEEGSSLK